MPLITGCLRDYCYETFSPSNPLRIPPSPTADHAQNNLQHASTVYLSGITQGMVQVHHALVRVHMTSDFGT